ncbi:MAG: SIMPL domain-containing protein [Alphaproteobacteria bacterium]|nr:SIMPL domain-containing protein [Alphaproteobacteria bacterium]
MARNIILFAAAALWAGAAAAQAPMPRNVTVSGEGKVEAVPDRAILPVTLENKEKTLALAKQKNDAQAAALMKVAESFGLPKEKLKTTGFYLAPQYRFEPGTNRQIFDGYLVSRSIELTLDKQEQTEEVIAALAKAGIDRIQGLRFTLSHPKEQEAQARKEAMDDARAKASQLAAAAGAKLGPVMTIQLQGGGWRDAPRPVFAAAMAKAEAVPPPVLPGLETLEQQVTVTYELQ